MKYILKTGLVMFIVLAFVSIGYGQEAYRFETSASYLSVDADDVEVTAYGLAGTFHFVPVNVSGNPLAEAAFMERIGDVSLMIGQTEYDTNGGDADGPVYGISLLYAQPGKPIVAKASWNKEDIEIDGLGDEEITTDAYGVGIGAYLGDALRLMVSYDRSEMEESWSAAETENDIFGCEVKWVNEMANDRALNLEGEIVFDSYDDGADDGTNTIFGIAGDYYFNSSISAGAMAALNTGDNEGDEGITMGLRSRLFIVPQFSIAGEYGHFSADNDGVEDSDSFEITLALRF